VSQQEPKNETTV